MRVVIPLEMTDMKGGTLQSVELLLQFLPQSAEKIVYVPPESGTAERMRAAGANPGRDRRCEQNLEGVADQKRRDAEREGVLDADETREPAGAACENDRRAERDR